MALSPFFLLLLLSFQGQNALMLVINVIQLSLFVIYPSDPSTIKDQQKTKKKRNKKEE